MDQFERAEQSLIVPVQSRAVATALTPIGKYATPAQPYQRGTITQHQQQAVLHRRKARSGGKAVMYGTEAALVGYGLRGAVGSDVTPTAARIATRVGHAGAATALGGVGYAAYHTHRGNKEAERAQAARKQRNAEQLSKDYGGGYRAGDATRRHDRAVEAGAAGAAGVTGTRAVRARGEAKTQRALSATYRQAAARSDDVLAQRMMRHARAGKPGGLPTINANMAHTAQAVKVSQNLHGKAGDAAKAAFRASRRAKGAAAATAGLVGLAAAVHRREQPAPVRSVGYR